jgi:hypothetical protein
LEGRRTHKIKIDVALGVRCQVLGNAVSRGLHSLLAFAPIGRADLAMFLGELQGVDQPQGLVNASAQGKVIHQGMTYNAFFVDQE